MPGFSSEQRVVVKPTVNRPFGRPDYFVILHSKVAELLKLGRWAVLSFQHPGLPATSSREARFISIHCRVKTDDTVILEEDGTPLVLVDQTIRNALGVPFRIFRNIQGAQFFLTPARRSNLSMIRKLFAQIFGIRYIAVRCQSAAVPDIEKNYVRVPADVVKAVAMQEGDDLIVERPIAICTSSGQIREFIVRDIKIRSLIATDRFIDDRRSLMKEFGDRYLDSPKALYDYKSFHEKSLLTEIVSSTPNLPEPDVPAIYMDADTRGAWTRDHRNAALPGFRKGDIDGIVAEPADGFTPMLVRRSIRSSLARDSLQTGIAFLLVLFQFTLAMDLDPGRVSGRELVTAFIVATTVGLTLLRFRLRQQV